MPKNKKSWFEQEWRIGWLVAIGLILVLFVYGSVNMSTTNSSKQNNLRLVCETCIDNTRTTWIYCSKGTSDFAVMSPELPSWCLVKEKYIQLDEHDNILFGVESFGK